MKKKCRKLTLLAFVGVLVIFLFGCKNPFLANADGKYQVSFETNCNTKIDSYRTDKIESIKELTKEDYVFGGWYTNSSFIGTPITFPYKLTQDITLYAKWSIKTFSVSYVTEHGTTPSTIIVNIGQNLTESQLPKLTDSEYLFEGWYLNTSFNDGPITLPYKVTQDITLYAKWSIKTFSVSYVTEHGTAPSTIIVNIGHNLTEAQLPELKDSDYVFEGWYTNATFDGEAIKLPYKIKENTILYAKWIDKSKILTFEGCNSTSDFVEISNSYDNVDCSDGLLTIGSKYEKIIFKNSQSTDLRIKLSNPKAKVVFDKIIFSSSKGSLVESFSDILIEYYGNNELSSSASSALSLIKSSGTVEFRGKNNGKFELQPNTVTNSTDGSVGVKANKVIIDGGNFVIKGNDGWNNYAEGRNGGDGSSGIEATETIIRNNAVVTIEAGNGANGNNGYDGSSGYDQPENNSNLLGKRAPDGTDGTSGGSGGNGGSGGSAIKGKLIAEVCKITLTGGKGGNGGNGGSGGRGGNGSHNSTNWEIFHWCCGGGNGGNGGKGGDGGTGGNGGDAITGSYSGNNCSANLASGKKGSAGNGGTGGAAGSEGGAGWGCGDSGNSGSKGTNGASGNPGKDGVEHR